MQLFFRLWSLPMKAKTKPTDRNVKSVLYLPPHQYDPDVDNGYLLRPTQLTLDTPRVYNKMGANAHSLDGWAFLTDPDDARKKDWLAMFQVRRFVAK